MDVDAIGENFLISLLQQLIISCDETITNLRSCDASQPLSFMIVPFNEMPNKLIIYHFLNENINSSFIASTSKCPNVKLFLCKSYADTIYFSYATLWMLLLLLLLLTTYAHNNYWSITVICWLWKFSGQMDNLTKVAQGLKNIFFQMRAVWPTHVIFSSLRFSRIS